jgi:hypothetical protein
MVLYIHKSCLKGEQVRVRLGGQEAAVGRREAGKREAEEAEAEPEPGAESQRRTGPAARALLQPAPGPRGSGSSPAPRPGLVVRGPRADPEAASDEG